MMAAMDAGADLSSLRLAVSAGETLPAPVFRDWMAKTGTPILDGIGTTELLHIFISNRVGDAHPGCTGRTVTGYEARVVDEHMREVPRGVVGRLAVRGPTGCRYLADARQTSYVRDGWNLTGDAFAQDEDGRFHFAARTDDMILSAGYNIAGPEVEAALLPHPDVGECAVVGAARRRTRPDRRRLRRAPRRRRVRRCHGEAPAGSREGVDRSLQVSASRLVRRSAAEDGNREDPALPHSGTGMTRRDPARTSGEAMAASHLDFLHPEGWAPPRGYANGVSAEGRTLFVAGQIGWNARGEFESDDFVAQLEQALQNVVAVLHAGGAKPEDLVRMTWYITDKAAYVARRREIGAAYRACDRPPFSGDDAGRGDRVAGGPGARRDRGDSRPPGRPGGLIPQLTSVVAPTARIGRPQRSSGRHAGPSRPEAGG